MCNININYNFTVLKEKDEDFLYQDTSGNAMWSTTYTILKDRYIHNLGRTLVENEYIICNNATNFYESIVALKIVFNDEKTKFDVSITTKRDWIYLDENFVDCLKEEGVIKEVCKFKRIDDIITNILNGDTENVIENTFIKNFEVESKKDLNYYRKYYTELKSSGILNIESILKDNPEAGEIFNPKHELSFDDCKNDKHFYGYDNEGYGKRIFVDKFNSDEVIVYRIDEGTRAIYKYSARFIYSKDEKAFNIECLSEDFLKYPIIDPKFKAPKEFLDMVDEVFIDTMNTSSYIENMLALIENIELSNFEAEFEFIEDMAVIRLIDNHKNLRSFYYEYDHEYDRYVATNDYGEPSERFCNVVVTNKEAFERLCNEVSSIRENCNIDFINEEKLGGII